MNRNMDTKRPVKVSIESLMDGQSVRQQAEGDLYLKGGRYYLRYNEEDPEMKGTVTTMKLEETRIWIARSGSVRSEQTFVVGQRCRGSYETPQGSLELHTVTSSMSAELSEGLGTVEWSYELFVQGEPTGVFRLRLTIAER
ncbi:DUF1934 domain-containing protein [Paenibacillus doosanensis]|uniref:Beta-barrel protein YwiB n=1 Tax=Paenibacillus konkukensis TaxID=2020716 RepID=A0ABY4RRT8_9BACL|nr:MULTISPECIES: DUF1934 domain-containing protein [Paenibacillus]MCS7464556.1 DUF1934 domain-containing protein [Paenibacillus doosanensis]UQZ84858.1 putative beta-barrel protein YwiB [Paenibacillus konkukensis]